MLVGGDVDIPGCYISPTLIEQAPANASIMQEEIFGPVLPVVPYRDISEVVRQSNAAAKPPTLNIVSKNKAIPNKNWANVAIKSLLGDAAAAGSIGASINK